MVLTNECMYVWHMLQVDYGVNYRSMDGTCWERKREGTHVPGMYAREETKEGTASSKVQRNGRHCLGVNVITARKREDHSKI